MAFHNFTTPILIENNKFWTAELESFNQRTDDLYYDVSIWKGDVFQHKFSVKIIAGFPEQEQIHALVIKEKTNTSYTGWNQNKKNS